MDAPGPLATWPRPRWRRLQAGRRAAARVGPDPTVHHDAHPTDGDDVRAAVQRLSDRDREVLVLRHHLELSVAEVADELGITRER